MNLNTRTTSLALILGLATLSANALGQNFYSFSWLGMADSLSGGTNTSYLDSHSGPIPAITSFVSGDTVYSDPVGGDLTLSGTAKGRSTYIEQGTYASASLTNAHAIASGNPGQYYQAAGIAGYSTSFTVFGPSLVEADVYTEKFTYTIEGTSESAPGIESQGFIYSQVGTDGAEGTYITGNTTFVTSSHSFHPGVSNFYQLEMDCWVNLNVDDLVAGGTYSATTDFYHTMKLTGVEIDDANGNAVNDFEILDSNNGTKVFGSGTLAPEPCSMAALSLGVVALIRRRKKA